ncbi:MAG: HisA/HisF-related TIM barrel protein, partial [Crocinitomicaceae bacterium]
NSLSQIEKLIHAGAEKVVICSEALHRPEFIQEASQEFGSSTIAVCMDVGKTFFGGTKLYSHSGSKAHTIELESFAKKMQDFGAGELIIQSIVQDGKMTGYNHEISAAVAKKISIPVTVLGGAGSMEDIKSLHQQHPFNGYAAGSLFVYQGKHRGVLINYPNQEIKVKSTTRL